MPGNVGFTWTVDLPAVTLPPPWVSQDVGAVGLPGSATFSSGTFTLEGSGTGLGGTADQFQSVFQSLSGDREIRARVTGVENTSTLARAGVMIRETLTSNSTFAAAMLSANNRIGFQRRLSTEQPLPPARRPGAPPRWVRLVRSGNTSPPTAPPMVRAGPLRHGHHPHGCRRLHRAGHHQRQQHHPVHRRVG